TLSPYPFSARVSGGAVEIAGATPDARFGEAIARAAGPGARSEALTLASGVPDRDIWEQAVGFALRYMSALDEGSVELSDLTLTVSGRARSQEALAALAGFRAEAPRGVVVAAVEIVPP